MGLPGFVVLRSKNIFRSIHILSEISFAVCQRSLYSFTWNLKNDEIATSRGVVLFSISTQRRRKLGRGGGRGTERNGDDAGHHWTKRPGTTWGITNCRGAHNILRQRYDVKPGFPSLCGGRSAKTSVQMWKNPDSDG